MNDDARTPNPGPADSQRPHVPGHDPLGSGMPRQQESGKAQPSASADETDEPDPVGGDAALAPSDDDAPLGGDENTEEQLTADTAVERDALKSLDPDDTPA